MTVFPSTLPGIAAAVGPGAVALALALAGRWTLRPGVVVVVVAAAAVCAGWALLAGAPRAWVWPRGVLEHLPGAALAVALGALVSLRVAGRWPGVLAAGVAAWWIAGAPAARPEAWRVWFATMALTWLLRRVDAGAARPAATLALTLCVGLVAADAALPVVGVAFVLLLVALAMAGRGGVALPAAVPALAVVGCALAGGRVAQGVVGFADLVCAAAVAGAWVSGWAASGLRRRLRRGSELAAPVLVAVGSVAVAWVLARAIRGGM